MGFLCLAVITLVLDKASGSWLATLRDALVSVVFGSGQATSRLLAAVVTGLITITSITFSVLLLAVQQAMTW